MDFHECKILILGEEKAFLDSLNNGNVKDSETLVVTKEKAANLKQDSKKILPDTYILKILQKENDAVGVVAIDKVMGDIVVIKSDLILINKNDYNSFLIKDINVNSSETIKYISDYKSDLIKTKLNPLSKEEIIILAQKFLSNLKIISSLDQIRAVKNIFDQAKKTMENKKFQEFLETFAELLTRNKIEQFDERSNVYSIIEQLELESEIYIAQNSAE